jgi:hypothetical protein
MASNLGSKEMLAVSLALDTSDLVKELQSDWEYLSEETDRWGKKFDFDRVRQQPNRKTTEFLVVEHVQQFERKYRSAVGVGLNPDGFIPRSLLRFLSSSRQLIA